MTKKKRLGRAGDRKWHKNGGEQKGVKLNEKEEEIGVEGEMTGVMTVKNWFIQKKGREERRGEEKGNFLKRGVNMGWVYCLNSCPKISIGRARKV